MILDCNRKSNVTAPRPIKTAIQKLLFHRLSGWWEKKPEKTVTFKIPTRYESDPSQIVGALPDELVSKQNQNQDLSNDEEFQDEDDARDDEFEDPMNDNVRPADDEE